MSRDPFLAVFGIWLDRAMVWLTLALVSFLLLWSLVWERCLGGTWLEALNQLRAVVTGQAAPIVTVQAALSLAVAMETTTLLSTWLFARWRRQGQPDAAHLRGSRLGD